MEQRDSSLTHAATISAPADKVINTIGGERARFVTPALQVITPKLWQQAHNGAGRGYVYKASHSLPAVGADSPMTKKARVVDVHSATGLCLATTTA